MFFDNSDAGVLDEHLIDTSIALILASNPMTLPSGSTYDISTIFLPPSFDLPFAPRLSNWVREFPIRLRDYHCFSTALSLYELQFYSETSSNFIWQQNNDRRTTTSLKVTYMGLG